MWQTSLFDEDFSARMINVSTIRKLSPFRYPGGKTWFVPYIRQWLSPAVRDRYHLTPIHPVHFIEPFLGGGSISLTVASERLVAHITMVELDIDVSSAWQTVLNAADGEWLAREILSYNLTIENVESLMNETPATVRRRAFQTIIKNRVNRGGILAPGAGLLKRGENGKGIRSRWYPDTLARRIHHIISIRDRITFIHGDGLEVLATHVNDPNAVFFIDPPYTAGENGKRAGKRLYTCNELDHERLFDLASYIQGDFLMTYDDSDEVRSLAARYGLDIRLLPMNNTHHAKMSELLIGRNLDWVHIPS
jgi:DNA adenine methylase